MFKRALISVSDKSGLIDFIKSLNLPHLEIVSTGGTAKFLQENGIKVIEVSEITKFPEVLGGRVKTLHPMVHMGLLAKTSSAQDMKTLAEYNVAAFDLVIVNLYPFEQAFAENQTGWNSALVEKIDVGGPCMLRAAAKNYASVSVLCDPEDYSYVLSNRQEWDENKRKFLAAKVFARVSVYDSLIARAMLSDGGQSELLTTGVSDEESMQQIIIPKHISVGGQLKSKLRYGENPQQKAAWYEDPFQKLSFSEAQILQGKELSYNNLLDLDAALSTVQELSGLAAVAVKHNNPCGAAIGDTESEVIFRVLKADPVSVFGGIIATNFKIDLAAAKMLNEIFLECVLAPEYTAEALQEFSKKKNLRILSWPQMKNWHKGLEFRSFMGGFLVQSPDKYSDDSDKWDYPLSKPDKQILSDLKLGMKLCGSLKSNAIALVYQGQSVGLGMGQVNRVDAVEQAIKRCKQHHSDLLSKCVLASDAFFPFPDSIDLIAEAGIKWIIQPGGSIKDKEVLQRAKDRDIGMVLCHTRHFKH